MTGRNEETKYVFHTINHISQQVAFNMKQLLSHFFGSFCDVDIFEEERFNS